MHDLPVSTTERRPETSLDVAQLQFIAHQPRDGRTGSHTGRKKGAIPTARKQHWSRNASRGRPVGSSVSYGAGDGNRTHVRSLGSFYTAIVRRPLTSILTALYTISRRSIGVKMQSFICKVLPECRRDSADDRVGRRSSCAVFTRQHQAFKSGVHACIAAAARLAHA